MAICLFVFAGAAGEALFLGGDACLLNYLTGCTSTKSRTAEMRSAEGTKHWLVGH